MKAKCPRHLPGAKPPGGKIRKWRALNSEERLYNLAAEVNRACSRWLLARGLTVETSASAKRKIDWPE